LQSWANVLRPYRPEADQPKTRIDVSYAAAAGNLALYAQIFAISDSSSDCGSHRKPDHLARPLLIEMRSCGVTAATWPPLRERYSVVTRLAEDFAELYPALNMSVGSARVKVLRSVNGAHAKSAMSGLAPLLGLSDIGQAAYEYAP